MRLRPLISGPEDVLNFTEPSPAVLCTRDLGFRILSFDMCDASVPGGTVLYNSQQEENSGSSGTAVVDEDATTTQRIVLPSDYLKCALVRSTLRFAVGPEGLPSLRMIERHFFHDTVLRSFDFTFGPCPPKSVNSWDITYDLPSLSQELEEQVRTQPYAVATDTFFFAGNTLVYHARREHSYKDWLCSSSASAVIMPSLMAPVALARGLRLQSGSPASAQLQNGHGSLQNNAVKAHVEGTCETPPPEGSIHDKECDIQRKREKCARRATTLEGPPIPSSYTGRASRFQRPCPTVPPATIRDGAPPTAPMAAETCTRRPAGLPRPLPPSQVPHGRRPSVRWTAVCDGPDGMC